MAPHGSSRTPARRVRPPLRTIGTHRAACTCKTPREGRSSEGVLVLVPGRPQQLAAIPLTRTTRRRKPFSRRRPKQTSATTQLPAESPAQLDALRTPSSGEAFVCPLSVWRALTAHASHTLSVSSHADTTISFARRDQNVYPPDGPLQLTPASRWELVPARTDHQRIVRVAVSDGRSTSWAARANQAGNIDAVAGRRATGRVPQRLEEFGAARKTRPRLAASMVATSPFVGEQSTAVRLDAGAARSSYADALHARAILSRDKVLKCDASGQKSSLKGRRRRLSEDHLWLAG